MNRFFDRLFAERPELPAAVGLVDEPFPATLASCIPGSYFEGRFRATWYETAARPQVNRQWLQDRIVGSADEVTRAYSVARLDSAQLAANGVLQELRMPTGTPVLNLSVAVYLHASEEAIHEAKQWEKLQTQLEVQRMKAELELDRLRHLRTEIFGDPSVARTYWLDKHPERPDDIFGDRFERIAEALGAETGPSTTQIANILRVFLADLDSEDKKTLVMLLNNVLVHHRREDLATRLPQDLG